MKAFTKYWDVTFLFTFVLAVYLSWDSVPMNVLG